MARASDPALGPQPLIRHTSERQLCIDPQGLDLLRRAGAPVHVAFTIGGSRCGKSTVGNALIFGPTAKKGIGFQTGSEFDPVTEGIDVAVRLLPSGGALVVGDCEGAFHICGSQQSARGFGALGLLAYHMSSALLHVSMGSIDERDIEALGYLAACACCESSSVGAQQGEADNKDAPESVSHSLAPPASVPGLVLIVNGSRFDLGDAVAKKLLRPPEASGVTSDRWCARASIAQAFRGNPLLEALPACDHAAYWPRVEAMQKRIFELPPVMLPSGLQASGNCIAHRVAALVKVLNGESNEAPKAILEPVPATEAMYRSTHLEPLVEEIARRFATTGAATDRSYSSRPTEVQAKPALCSVEEALWEFDRRTSWLTGKDTNGSPNKNEDSSTWVVVRQELVAEMRTRLSARLTGINEALIRGRQQGAALKRKAAKKPGSIGVGSVSDTDSGCGDKEAATPKSAARMQKRWKELETMVEDMERHADKVAVDIAEELSQLESSVRAAQQQAQQINNELADADCQAASGIVALQDRWQGLLSKTAEQRGKWFTEQKLACKKQLTAMQDDVLQLGDKMPIDLSLCSGKLSDFRNELEGGRLKRCEAGNAAAQTVENQIQALRASLDYEGGALATMRGTAKQHLSELVEDIHECLDRERCQRIDRYTALGQVVDQLRQSLMATAEAMGAPELQLDDSMLKNSPEEQVGAIEELSGFSPPH